MGRHITDVYQKIVNSYGRRQLRVLLYNNLFRHLQLGALWARPPLPRQLRCSSCSPSHSYERPHLHTHGGHSHTVWAHTHTPNHTTRFSRVTHFDTSWLAGKRNALWELGLNISRAKFAADWNELSCHTAARQLFQWRHHLIFSEEMLRDFYNFWLDGTISHYKWSGCQSNIKHLLCPVFGTNKSHLQDNQLSSIGLADFSGCAPAPNRFLQ